MNRNTVVGILGVAALAGAVAITAMSSSDAAVTQIRSMSEVTGFCMYTLPDAAGTPVLHLRVTAVCQEKDEQGAVVRAEPCDVDKPARWWVDNGLMSQGQITSLHAIWDHAGNPANVGKAVPRKRLDGTEVLEDLR